MITVLQNTQFSENLKVERRKKISASPGQAIRLKDFQDFARVVENDSINAAADNDAETDNISSTGDSFSTANSSSSEDYSADLSDNDSSNHNESLSLDDINATTDEDGVDPWVVEVGVGYIAEFRTFHDQRVKCYTGKVISLSADGSEVVFDSLCCKHNNPPSCSPAKWITILTQSLYPTLNITYIWFQNHVAIIFLSLSLTPLHVST